MNSKQQLNESMSSIAYHFCPIDALWAIMKSKVFKLTPTSTTSVDDREKCTIGGYTYPYYMCFSRSHSCLNGYVRRRLEGDATWRNCVVRITVDGNKFNYNFKSVPVNVYSDANDDRISKKFEKTINQEDNPKTRWLSMTDYLKERDAALRNGATSFPTFKQWKTQENQKLGNVMGVFKFKKGDRNSGTLNRELTSSLDRDSQFKQMLEFEDRLLSNKPTIPAFPYIKRIDILVTEIGIGDNSIVQMIGDILTRFNDYTYMSKASSIDSKTTTNRSYKLPIHVYDTISSFEANTNEINPTVLLNKGENFEKNLERHDKLVDTASNFSNINKSFLKQNSDVVSRKFKPLLTESQLKVIATAISALISIDCRGVREFKNTARSLIRTYGLNNGYLDGVNYEKIIMRNLTYFDMNMVSQIKARNTWNNTRKVLRGGFIGDTQKYANAVRQMYDDFMSSHNWKYNTFGQFQTALNNRYEDYTGRKLPQNLQAESNLIKKLVISESQYYRLF